MHNKSHTKYFQVAQGFVGRRETGVGYTISLYSGGDFLVSADYRYGIVFACIFVVLGYLRLASAFVHSVKRD